MGQILTGNSRGTCLRVEKHQVTHMTRIASLSWVCPSMSDFTGHKGITACLYVSQRVGQNMLHWTPSFVLKMCSMVNEQLLGKNCKSGVSQHSLNNSGHIGISSDGGT